MTSNSSAAQLATNSLYRSSPWVQASELASQADNEAKLAEQKRYKTDQRDL